MQLQIDWRNTSNRNRHGRTRRKTRRRDGLWRGYLILTASVTRGGDLVSLARLARDRHVELELGAEVVGEGAFLDRDQRWAI